MDLRHLTDETLLVDAKAAAQRERDALSVVLHHLREVDRRRLFSALKYESINQYAIGELKYSEDEAWLRVSAMRLLKELPAIEPKINDGSLSLSNLNLVRRTLAQEAKVASRVGVAVVRSVEDKLEILSKIENMTKREAQKVLYAETGVVVKSFESTRELSDGTFELKIIVDKDTFEQIERMKGVLAHSNPSMSNGELVSLAVTTLAEKRDPLKKAERALKRAAKKSVIVPERSKQVLLANAPERLDQKMSLTVPERRMPTAFGDVATRSRSYLRTPTIEYRIDVRRTG